MGMKYKPLLILILLAAVLCLSCRYMGDRYRFTRHSRSIILMPQRIIGRSSYNFTANGIPSR
jgi:hypothetical protein